MEAFIRTCGHLNRHQAQWFQNFTLAPINTPALYIGEGVWSRSQRSTRGACGLAIHVRH
jgi:hypothetical protein